jgi:hypothetical protein
MAKEMAATLQIPLAPRKVTAPVTLSRDGVIGYLVTVEGEITLDTMPMLPEQRDTLMASIHALAVDYGLYGLPLRVFYFHYESTCLVGVISRHSMVLVWAAGVANLIEIEAIARKVASTAHLNPTTKSVPLHDLLKPAATAADEKPSSASGPLSSSTLDYQIMNWNDATQALESILTKVLAQAQAGRLIDKTLTERGVSKQDSFDLELYAAIGRELMTKIPHKVLRASLSKEFENQLTKM